MITATDKAYNEILRRILILELPPGTYISRNEIAEQLNISKTPIREALQHLEQDGLVKIFPQSKTLVTKIDINKIKRTNFLRIAIEAEVVREMILNYDDEAIMELGKTLKKQEEMLDDITRLEEFNELDREFHNIMFKAVDQEELNDLLKLKMGHKIRARRLELPRKGKAREIYEDHKAVYEAIKEKNLKQADKYIRKHLTGTVSKIEDIKKEKPYFFD